MFNKILKNFWFLPLIISVNVAYAQYSSTISSDRPGNANGAATVGKGILQFQAGLQLSGNNYLNTDYGNIDIKDTEFSENLVVRYGLAERFEMSAVLNYTRGVYKSTSQEMNYSGFNTTMLRARVKVIDNLAFQAGLNVPLLRNDFSNDYSSPQLEIMYNTNFNEKMNLTTNLGAQWGKISEDPNGFYVFSFSSALPADFSIILESYGTFNLSGVQNYYDAGVAYLINPDMLLDLNAGWGKNYNVKSYFVTAGISYRLKTAYRDK